MTRARWSAFLCALVFSATASAQTGRLLTTEAAEVVSAPVVGLQRTALALPAGFSVDTGLLADLLLVLNAGVRWGVELGAHRVVVGARYAHFVGTPVYSALLQSQEPQLQRFEPMLSGPTFYAVYGVALGSVLLQVEGKLELMQAMTGSVTAGARFSLGESFAIIAEGGYRFLSPAPVRAAAGVRYGGPRGFVTVGAAYVGLSDPMLPELPVLPVIDLAWRFQ